MKKFFKKLTDTLYFWTHSHFRFLTESQLNQLDFELPKTKYDEKEVRQMFSDSFPCPVCNKKVNYLSLDVSIKFNNSIADVIRNCNCDCGKYMEVINLRLRNGYIMKKQSNGEYICAILQSPRILQSIQNLF